MSMRILVIPEDFRNDQYILKPLLTKLCREAGRRSAKVVICQDPRLGGVGEALKSDRLAAIVDRYKAMIDVFVLCVDRDGDQGRRAKLEHIETKFKPTAFLAENAWEELETWLLAGLQQLPPGWSWSKVRAEINVKEVYFEPLARKRNLTRHPGGGREILGREAASNIAAIRNKCPEDFDSLARRIEAHLQTT